MPVTLPYAAPIVPRATTHDALVELLTTSGPSMGDVFVVEDASARILDPAAVERLGSSPCIVIGREKSDLVDVVAADDDTLDAILDTVRRAPLASAALALHLRGCGRRTIPEGLVAESALYSALQAGPEFQAWRASTPVRQRPADTGPAVVASRDGDELRIELARPEVHNAFNVEVRDGLLEALAVADADPSVRVTISGRGRSFCSGGDLDEFGTAPDPATAHLIRLQRSVGAVLARVSDRVTVELHGACYGSGIELPAFAGRVVARPDTLMALPELGLGLVPGAGGTVSIPNRIGRHATALMAFTRRPVDAATALQWGLVDELA